MTIESDAVTNGNHERTEPVSLQMQYSFAFSAARSVYLSSHNFFLLLTLVVISISLIGCEADKIDKCDVKQLKKYVAENFFRK